jgi:molybdopterin/thiamine biosynthesis adenylyltransferase
MDRTKFDRNTRFFGEEGQIRIGRCKVAVVGVGGLGTHVIQQLALLGVRELSLIDAEELAESNRNRYVGVRHDDPIPGTRKVDLGERIAKEIDPSTKVTKIFDSLVSQAAFEAITKAHCVFGCVDRDGARLVLNELCAAYSTAYIDLATEILPGESPIYGGRACVNYDGQGCIVCLDLLDVTEAQRDLSGPEMEKTSEALYGVGWRNLGRVGPSVVSLNGLVASMGVTEFMVAVTGVRQPIRLAKFYGNIGKVVISVDPPEPDCYYCKSIRGQGEAADVKRYIREGIGEFMR